MPKFISTLYNQKLFSLKLIKRTKEIYNQSTENFYIKNNIEDFLLKMLNDLIYKNIENISDLNFLSDFIIEIIIKGNMKMLFKINSFTQKVLKHDFSNHVRDNLVVLFYRLLNNESINLTNIELFNAIMQSVPPNFINLFKTLKYSKKEDFEDFNKKLHTLYISYLVTTNSNIFLKGDLKKFIKPIYLRYFYMKKCIQIEDSVSDLKHKIFLKEIFLLKQSLKLLLKKLVNEKTLKSYKLLLKYRNLPFNKKIDKKILKGIKNTNKINSDVIEIYRRILLKNNKEEEVYEEIQKFIISKNIFTHEILEIFFLNATLILFHKFSEDLLKKCLLIIFNKKNKTKKKINLNFEVFQKYKFKDKNLFLKVFINFFNEFPLSEIDRINFFDKIEFKNNSLIVLLGDIHEYINHLINQKDFKEIKNVNNFLSILIKNSLKNLNEKNLFIEIKETFNTPILLKYDNLEIWENFMENVIDICSFYKKYYKIKKGMPNNKESIFIFRNNFLWNNHVLKFYACLLYQIIFEDISKLQENLTKTKDFYTFLFENNNFKEKIKGYEFFSLILNPKTNDFKIFQKTLNNQKEIDFEYQNIFIFLLKMRKHQITNFFVDILNQHKFIIMHENFKNFLITLKKERLIILNDLLSSIKFEKIDLLKNNVKYLEIFFDEKLILYPLNKKVSKNKKVDYQNISMESNFINLLGRILTENDAKLFLCCINFENNCKFFFGTETFLYLFLCCIRKYPNLIKDKEKEVKNIIYFSCRYLNLEI